MKNSSTSEQDIMTTVRGMVLPAQWNDRFEVTGILVACRDERELRVDVSRLCEPFLSRKPYSLA